MCVSMHCCWSSCYRSRSPTLPVGKTKALYRIIKTQKYVQSKKVALRWGAVATVARQPVNTTKGRDVAWRSDRARNLQFRSEAVLSAVDSLRLTSHRKAC